MISAGRLYMILASSDTVRAFAMLNSNLREALSQKGGGTQLWPQI